MLGIYMTLIDSAEDKSKFEQLYILYKQDMFKRAMSILRDEYESEDAVHEAFMRIAKNITKLGDVNTLQTKAYLIITVKNVAFSIYNKRKTVCSDELTEDTPDTISVEESAFLEIDMRKAINRLPESYSEILYLEQVKGLDAKQIAVILGITVANANKRLLRAKQKLRTEVYADGK